MDSKKKPDDNDKNIKAFKVNQREQLADKAIVRTIVHLGQSLGMSVTAEGVETEAQLAFLKAEGCDEMQGYLFSRPVPAEQMGALLGAGLVVVLPSAGVDVRIAALVGMAAMFAGASRALLASVVFAFERLWAMTSRCRHAATAPETLE